MPTLTVRNVEADLVASLKARAKRNKPSLEAEIRVLLRDAVHVGSRTSLRELADRFAKIGRDDADRRRQRRGQLRRRVVASRSWCG